MLFFQEHLCLSIQTLFIQLSQNVQVIHSYAAVWTFHIKLDSDYAKTAFKKVVLFLFHGETSVVVQFWLCHHEMTSDVSHVKH